MDPMQILSQCSLTYNIAKIYCCSGIDILDNPVRYPFTIPCLKHRVQPVAETQQPVAEQRDYAAEVEMLKAQNHKVIGEKKAFQKQVGTCSVSSLTCRTINNRPSNPLAEAVSSKRLDRSNCHGFISAG